jgi:adenosylhomocysteine nucleosidase
MNKKVFIVASPLETGIINDINGSPIIYSGVGKINATMAAYKAFTDGYTEVINIGSCGSLKHKRGTIINVGLIYQDIDGTPLCEYGVTPFENAVNIVINRLSDLTCFTTDYFVDLSQIDKYSPSYISMIHRCDCFDMECFAIAKVCKRFNMTFKAYKWVSDNGGDVSWEENCSIGFDKVKKLL